MVESVEDGALAAPGAGSAVLFVSDRDSKSGCMPAHPN